MNISIPVHIQKPGTQNPFTPGAPAPLVEEHLTIVLDSEDVKKALVAVLGAE